MSGLALPRWRDTIVSGATIKLFLVHGDANRLRTAELSNWSGKAIAAPRTEFDQLLGREELQGSGVYILAGHDPDTGSVAAGARRTAAPVACQSSLHRPGSVVAGARGGAASVAD